MHQMIRMFLQRMEAFEAILGQHVLANHVDQMSIDEVEQTVNQVEFILEI